jgi:hypothetical protein
VNFRLNDAIGVLERTPAALQSMLDGLVEPWIRGNEGPETFSAFDNVGHLIDGEETDWIVRARLILAQSKSMRFEPYDRFRHYKRNAGRTLASLLTEFADLRARNLKELRGWKLTDKQLDLPGEHPSLGTVTLRQLLATWVVHDLGHIAQVARVMAKQYSDQVGPWTPFLPVLTDHLKPRSLP